MKRCCCSGSEQLQHQLAAVCCVSWSFNIRSNPSRFGCCKPATGVEHAKHAVLTEVLVHETAVAAGTLSGVGCHNSCSLHSGSAGSLCTLLVTRVADGVEGDWGIIVVCLGVQPQTWLLVSYLCFVCVRLDCICRCWQCFSVTGKRVGMKSLCLSKPELS